MPALCQLWRLYFRRFAIDHWYRFAKQRLHWTLPNLSTPEQSERWSDLLPLMTWQLWLARDFVRPNFWLVRTRRLCLCSSELYETVGELIGGLTHHCNCS